MRATPDVVVMDVRMPRMDGIEATRRLLAMNLGTRVLILTTFDHDAYVYEAVRAGASGVLLKSAPPRELAGAIRTVAAGETPPALAALTPRELEVLGLIAQGHANAEIAQTLFLSSPTVKTHITRILSKLDLRDRIQAVVLAYECGLVRPGRR